MVGPQSCAVGPGLLVALGHGSFFAASGAEAEGGLIWMCDSIIGAPLSFHVPPGVITLIL